MFNRWDALEMLQIDRLQNEKETKKGKNANNKEGQGPGGATDGKKND